MFASCRNEAQSPTLIFNESRELSAPDCDQSAQLVNRAPSEFQMASVQNGWSIPVADVFDGGPGKDGIPSLQIPQLIERSEVDYLGQDELVVGYVSCDEAIAYPHEVLDWHEIVNDELHKMNYAIVYCPLTGSATCWNREINGEVTTFGVSGSLWNSNIVPYDRATDSNWSQLLMHGVSGSNVNRNAEQYPIIETTWATWQRMYPNTKVVSRNTGHRRQYGVYPYGSYKTSQSTIFPLDNADTRLHNKERVLAVFEQDSVIAFRFSTFNERVKIVEERIMDNNIVVVGSEDQNFLAAYSADIDEVSTLTFTPLKNRLPRVMEDNEGNQWDIFGRCVKGVREGQQLPPTRSYIAYWFALPAVYDKVEIYGMD